MQAELPISVDTLSWPLFLHTEDFFAWQVINTKSDKMWRKFINLKKILLLDHISENDFTKKITNSKEDLFETVFFKTNLTLFRGDEISGYNI